MKCPFSIPVDNKFDKFNRQVYRPCGTCAICRRNKVMSLNTRANYEFKKHKFSSFCTLTYDDNHLLSSLHSRDVLPSVSYSDARKFIDSVRHFVKRSFSDKIDKDFSYVYSLEYGTDTFRPHMHICFFGIDYTVAKKICNKFWKFGFCDVKSVSPATIRYVCKYLSKQVNGKLRDSQFFDKGILPPKVSWSKGLGSRFFQDNISDIQKYGAIRNGAKFISVPSYYKNKFFNFNDKSLNDISVMQAKETHKKKSLAKKFGFDTVFEFECNKARISARNELKKNINRKNSVDLAELSLT